MRKQYMFNQYLVAEYLTTKTNDSFHLNIFAVSVYLRENENAEKSDWKEVTYAFASSKVLYDFIVREIKQYELTKLLGE